MITIGLVQAQACEDMAANLETVRRYAAEAADAGCQVLCFPECFLTGYAPARVSELAVAADSAAVGELLKIAAQYTTDLLVGFMERASQGFYISHGLFRPDGSMHIYRKTHLGQREQQHFIPGDCLPVFSLTSGIKIGLLLCVETHYPEVSQTLSLRGAQILFAPHAVPRISGDRETIWKKYIPARSYDNRIFMACCNLWDPQRFGGGCLVTGPRGETVAACYEDRASLLLCPVEPSAADAFRDPAAARSRHYFPALRRKELYE